MRSGAAAATTAISSISMESTQLHTLNLTGVLSESKRIIWSRYWHFVSLSIFFIPLSFTLIILIPTLDHRQLLPDQPLITYLISSLIVYTLTLWAICTVTYSTHNSFFGENVKFFDALKSLTFSFLPLASTAIIAHVLIILISLSFILLVGIALKLVHNLGFIINHNSVYFMWFSATMGVILLTIVIYFYVEWSLACVVVVVESKWGFSALIRSSYLVKGMRTVSLLIMLLYGVWGGIYVWICSGILYVHNSWMFVSDTMFFSVCMMFVLLRIAAANTVLYNYCKALHGELEIEVSEGFVDYYMNLPSDGENVPHVVTVVPNVFTVVSGWSIPCFV